MSNIRLVTSATQVSQYLTCVRSWVAGYLLGIKQPQTEAMAFGTVGHSMLEKYSKIGKIPDEDFAWQFNKDRPIRYPGRSAKKCLKYIPAPGKGRPEHGFSFIIKGIKFIGYIDLQWEDEKGLWVTDYKFVSSFSSALDSESLAENVQATIYSTKALLENKSKKLDKVNLRWIYALSTKNPSARKVESSLTENQTKKQLKNLIDICEEMILLKEKLENKYGNDLKNLPNETKLEIINSLPPTVKSCSRYAGCYYLDKCKLTTEQLIEGDFEDMDNNLQDKLKGLGLIKYIKNPVNNAPEDNEPKIEEEKVAVQEAKKEMENIKAEMRGEKKTVSKEDILAQYVKKPKQHETEQEKREEPKTQLNAPEHYLEDIKEKQLQKEVQSTVALSQESCACNSFSLTDEEKRVLKGIIDRL